jgi:hypothetical protein
MQVKLQKELKRKKTCKTQTEIFHKMGMGREVAAF